MIKPIRWNTEKAETIRKDKTRHGFSFEDCVIALDNGGLLNVIDNPNYEGQRIFIIQIENYVYSVPFVETEDEIFLKTMVPSRKRTREYLGKKPT